MWTQEEATFEGTYYQVRGAINQPKGVQKPHIPLLIGGEGEKVTLRLVAQYADACNLSGFMGKEERQRKLSVLREHCQTLGRAYEQIEKTLTLEVYITRDGRNGTLSPQAAIGLFRELAAEGFEHVIVAMPNMTDAEPFDVLGSRIIRAIQ